jgi:hypothetical protein
MEIESLSDRESMELQKQMARTMLCGKGLRKLVASGE